MKLWNKSSQSPRANCGAKDFLSVSRSVSYRASCCDEDDAFAGELAPVTFPERQGRRRTSDVFNHSLSTLPFLFDIFAKATQALCNSEGWREGSLQ